MKPHGSLARLESFLAPPTVKPTVVSGNSRRLISRLPMRSTRTSEPNGGPPRHAAFSDALSANGIPYTLSSEAAYSSDPMSTPSGRPTNCCGRQPTRAAAQVHFDTQVLPSFPNANFVDITAVLAEWGRLIHAPVVPGTPRRRIYPQQLLYDLLESFRVSETGAHNATLLDIGVFSQIMQDVEAVYPSVDLTPRFQSILNFLSVVADRGYDTSTYEAMALRGRDRLDRP